MFFVISVELNRWCHIWSDLHKNVQHTAQELDCDSVGVASDWKLFSFMRVFCDIFCLAVLLKGLSYNYSFCHVSTGFPMVHGGI